MFDSRDEELYGQDNSSIAGRFLKGLAKDRKESKGSFKGFKTGHYVLMAILILAVYIAGVLLYGFIKSAFSPIVKQGTYNIFKLTVDLMTNHFFGWFMFLLFDVIIMVLIVYRIALDLRTFDRHGNEIDKSNIHGSSREMDEDTLKESYIVTDEHPEGIIIGRLPYASYSLVSAPWWSNLLHPLPNRNMWLCGASGSGKTKYQILHRKFQNLLEERNDISTDPKGEVFRETVAQTLYCDRDIYIFNTSSFEHSDGWDVIKMIRDSEEPEQDTELFVTTILEAQGKAQAAFFGPSIENVLYVATLYVAKAKSFKPFELINSPVETSLAGYDPGDYGTGLQYYKHRTYDEVYKLVSSLGGKGEYVDLGTKSMEEIVGLAIVSSPDDADLLRAPYSVWVGHKEKNNNQSSLAVELRKFSGRTVRKVLSTDEIDLKKILNEKASVYVVCDDGISPYKDILALFFSFLFKEIKKNSDMNSNGSLDIPLDIIWEELNNIGRITELGDFLSVCRSRNVGTLLCNQNIGQLMDKYKGVGGALPHEYLNILSNCAIQICAGSNDELTDEYFAVKGGNYSVFETSISHNLTRMGFKEILPQEREAVRGTKAQVFTPDDFEDLKISEEIVFSATQKGGVKLDKYFYKEHPFYRIKLKDNETGEFVKPHPNIHIPKWKGGKPVKDELLEKYEVVTLSEEEVQELVDKEYRDFLRLNGEEMDFGGFEEFL